MATKNTFELDPAVIEGKSCKLSGTLCEIYLIWSSATNSRNGGRLNPRLWVFVVGSAR